MQQPPPPRPQQPPAYGPPAGDYRDPHDYYVVGQDHTPAWVNRDERDNPQAITALSFGICGLGLLVISFGIAFVAALPCAIAGIVTGRRGMQAVDSGRATKHRRYAKAGFVMGIVSCSLASLIALGLTLAALFPDEFDDGGGEVGSLPLVRSLELLVWFAAGG